MNISLISCNISDFLFCKYCCKNMKEEEEEKEEIYTNRARHTTNEIRISNELTKEYNLN